MSIKRRQPRLPTYRSAVARHTGRPTHIRGCIWTHTRLLRRWSALCPPVDLGGRARNRSTTSDDVVELPIRRIFLSVRYRYSGVAPSKPAGHFMSTRMVRRSSTVLSTSISCSISIMVEHVIVGLQIVLPRQGYAAAGFGKRSIHTYAYWGQKKNFGGSAPIGGAPISKLY